MKGRCERPTHPKYPRYGALGIAVCDRWQRFENFLADMGERPSGKNIDRIDGKRGYSPENCRWATPMEQQSNISSNVYVEYEGKRQTISAWARETGIHNVLIGWRLRRGWSVEKALTVVPKHGNRVLRKETTPLSGA